MRAIWRLPRNPLAILVILLWWPLALAITVAYWVFFGFWWRLIRAPIRVRIIH